MMSILSQIVEHKRAEIEVARQQRPTSKLEKFHAFRRLPFSLRKSLTETQGVIAEIKRRSPSTGTLSENLNLPETALGYAGAGVSALSILTDNRFFGGSPEDLKTVRAHVTCPILRKEFILEDYQVVESKAIGADAILLIAAILSPTQLKILTHLAHDLGMEVLTEIHSEAELERALASAPDLVGVNNRDLRDFSIDVDRSHQLAGLIPRRFTRVSESGINSPAIVNELRRSGYQGFLIGQAFMRHNSPSEAARMFITNLMEYERRVAE